MPVIAAMRITSTTVDGDRNKVVSRVMSFLVLDGKGFFYAQNDRHKINDDKWRAALWMIARWRRGYDRAGEE
jgi:hypothetical protein